MIQTQDRAQLEASRIVCELTELLAHAASDEEADEIVCEHLTGDPEIDPIVVERLQVLELLKHKSAGR